MIELRFNRDNSKKIFIRDLKKNVEYRLSYESGEYYYAEEDFYYSSVTSFIKQHIGNPKIKIKEA